MLKAIRLVLASRRLTLLLLIVPLAVQAADRWKMQYFYDKSGASLDIRDLQCPSASRCIAAGAIEDNKGHSKGVVILTSDGGKNWSTTDVSERPVSLFFLNETSGWMVSERGLWATIDGGRSWKKLEGLKKGILQAYFLNPQHGYAIGFPKAVYETVDGGKKWTKLAAAENLAPTLQDTVFECITFLGNHGIIAGTAASAEDMPVWLNPSEAKRHRERPAILVVLETKDGGAHWESFNSSFYGRLTQLAMSNEGFSLALFEYHNYYELPSRVYKTNFHAGVHAVFGEKDRAATDVALLPDGGGLIAAVEPPGSSNQVPIPGKLKMLRSSNLKVWEEMPVDYRAVAQHATLASPDAEHLWVATDTGMILVLDKTAP